MHSAPDQERSVCGFCHRQVSRELYECVDTRGSRWKWSKCDHCGAHSLIPRPSDADLAIAYDSGYYGESETKFVGWSERFIEWCRISRAKRLSRSLKSDARVLDLGCGNGGFLSALAGMGSYDLHGIELQGGSATRALGRRGVNIKVGTLEPNDFEPGSLDLVTLFHVFEHLVDPGNTLEMIHRAMHRDARLVMSFPNIDSFQARLFRGDWLHLDPPRHLFLLPGGSFRRAMESYGFDVVAKRFFSVEQNPFGLIQSMLNAMGLPRDLLYERLKGNGRYASHHGGGSILMQKAFAGICLFPAIGIDAIESLTGKSATVEYTMIRRP